MSTWLNDKIRIYMELHSKKRIQLLAVFVMSIFVIVFVSTMLLKAGISFGDSNFKITADKVSAVYSEELEVSVKAKSLDEQDESVFLISSKSINAGLSSDYKFDKNNVTQITDAKDNVIDLHRVENNDGTVDYWFALGEDENTKFSLNFMSDYKEGNASGIILNTASASALENALDNLDAKQTRNSRAVDNEDDSLRLSWSRSGEDWNYKVSINWDDPDELYEKSDVTLSTDKIPLKYNVNVSTNAVAYDVGEMQIRLPLSLWTDRSGNSVLPSDLSLPKAPDVSNHYSFNYTIDDHGTPDDTSDDEIVVTNCKKLPPALNQTFSISYNVTPLNTIDLSKAEITANVSATDTLSQEEELQESNTITYQLDTGAQVQSLRNESAPKLLYTWDTSFGPEPDDFDTSKYNYVAYRYREYYQNNQPDQLTHQFTPSDDGEIVAIQCRNNVNLTEVDKNTYTNEFSTPNDWKYVDVVVAYPRDEDNPEPNYSLKYDLYIDAADRHPGHDTDADKNDHDCETITSNIQWKDYEFSYGGAVDGINKSSGGNLTTGLSLLEYGQEISLDYPVSCTVNGYNIDPYNFEFADDAIYIVDYNDKNGVTRSYYQELNEEDYYISQVYSLSVSHTDVDRTNGDTITLSKEPLALYGYNAQTDEWDLLREDISVGSSTFNFPDKNYTKVKVVSSDNLTAKYNVSFRVKIMLKPTSPRIKELREQNPGLSKICFENFVQMRRFDSATGEWTNGKTAPYDPRPPHNHYRNSGLADKDFEEYGKYLVRASSYADVRGLKYSYNAKKEIVQVRNDTINSEADITFGLSAHELMENIGSAESNNDILMDGFQLEKGTFYDLLPKGYQFSGEETVRVCGTKSSNDGAEVTSIQVIDDWRGTGRQMVIFEVKYVQKSNLYGGRNIYSSTGNTWGTTNNFGNGLYTGFSLQFDASITWDNLQYYSDETNLMAFHGNKHSGLEDLGAVSPHSTVVGEYDGELRSVFYDVDEDKNTEELTAYASVAVKPNVAMTVETGITKKVKASGNAEYSYSDIVNTNGEYSYRIGLGCSSSGSMSNIIIYDILEEASNTQGNTGEKGWHGAFTGMDISFLTVAGIKPVVYYSTVQGLKYGEETDLDITDTSKWTTKAPDDLSTVTAIAVDMRKNTSGDDFVLDAGKAINFEIKMKAPSALYDTKYAYNRTAYLSYFIPAGAQVGAESLNIGHRTEIELSTDVDIIIQKSDNNREITLSDVGFELYTANVSENGEWTKADSENPFLSFVTGKDGKYKIEQLVPGNYLLYETRAAAGYELPKEPWRITVKGDSSVIITDSNGNGIDSSVKFGETIHHIINSKAYTLPSTGGCGTEIIYITAAFMILMSAGGLWIKKRTEKNNERKEMRYKK